MINLDEMLQEKINNLERGMPVEQVLASLPPEASELAALIKLADATRKAPSPYLSHESSFVQYNRVRSATHNRPWLTRHLALPASLDRLVGSRSPKGMFALGGLALLVLVVVGISLLAGGPVSAHSARLEAVNGIVEVASSPAGTDWHFVTSGEEVQQGQRIRTYAGSGAELVFFEGTRTIIGGDADLIVTKLNGGWGNSLQVQLNQTSGDTTNNVVPLQGSGSFFLVDTPSGEASVHGTSFNVDVNADGQSLFAVTHGKVQVKTTKSQVFLNSGQAVVALPGDGMEQPGYQFSLQGIIDDIAGNVWTVAGVSITTTPQTEILGTYQKGDTVFVKGRIQPGNVWIADSIEPAQNDHQKSSFTGVIESMPPIPSDWVIGGITVKVNNETELDKNLQVGTPVKVTFVILPNNGGWLATEIEALEEEGKPTATPTATLTSTVTATATATSTSTVTPTATTTVTGTPPTPTPTSTPTVTPTPGTATPTPTATATVIPKNESSRCDNRTNQQPEALRLANRFGVTYDEIISWFCKGFGFGEIDLAYDLSQASGLPVSQIFSMRSSGLGWGQIKKQVNEMINPSGGNGNGKGRGKP